MNDDATINAWLNAAVQHHEAGEVNDARDYYMKVLDADQLNERALQLAGLLCLQAGELDGAEGLLKAALEVNPESSTIPNHLGAIALQRGDLKSATAFFEESVKLNPTYLEAHFN